MKLSFIIPILNEAENLPILLDHLLPYLRCGNEVILVDGGSTDGSRELAACMGFDLIHTQAGRAHQMNAGANRATGDVLVFLHADTILPENAGFLIQQALNSSTKLWGRFDVRIIGRSFMFSIISTMMNCRSRLSGIATGDQAIFVKRHVFESIGQFPDQVLMEDIELSTRLNRLSRPLCIRPPVKTSGRRWETYGIYRTILLMWRLRWLYWFGVTPEELKKSYK